MEPSKYSKIVLLLLDHSKLFPNTVDELVEGCSSILDNLKVGICVETIVFNRKLLGRG